MLVGQPLRSCLRLPQPSSSACAEPFFVEIAGDVPSPGIYAVCERSAILDLPAVSGGRGARFGFPAVLLSRLDLARGPKIIVRRGPRRYSFVLGQIQAHRRITLGIPLSLNEASEVELTAIPGVGPTLAGAIARERRSRGRFKRLDELHRVSGIGPKLYDMMKRYLVL